MNDALPLAQHMQHASSSKDYVAGTTGFVYPGVGESAPPGGAKVLLLTEGCIITTGTWAADGRFLAWSPLPRESDYMVVGPNGAGRPTSGNLLLLSEGGVCILGSWSDDAGLKGWAEMPTRDRVKESMAVPIRRAPGSGSQGSLVPSKWPSAGVPATATH